MTEFKINDFISLKLEHSKTNIYVKGNLFKQCKSLIFKLYPNEYKSLEEIASIDELIENNSIGVNVEISPELEFWNHCSNLQT